MNCQPQLKRLVYKCSLINQTCLLCDEPADQAYPLCVPCEQELPWLGDQCLRCALPLPLAGLTCAPCCRHAPAFE